jgi:hypothetical protein
MEPIEVRAWPSGKVSSGTAYIALCHIADRVKFERAAETTDGAGAGSSQSSPLYLDVVEIELDDIIAYVPLSRGFGNQCPEFRHREITAWLKKYGYVPWVKGRPPHFDLLPLGGNRFRLTMRSDWPSPFLS